MIVKAYYWLLWYLGFSDTDGNLETPNDREKITFMLRRAKERMGILWWLISLAIFFILEWQILIFHRWYLIPVYIFQCWLFAHILWPYKSPDDIWGGKT